MAPKGPKSILYNHSHVAYQLKGNEELNTVVLKFCPGACLGVTRGQKVGFLFLCFDCHTFPPRLFELEP